MTATDRPMVSVSIITWNQSAFIAQTIESALMQRTDFAVEIRVGDDFSTDGTREILIDYAQRHPDRIFLNLHPERAGGVPGRYNNMRNLASCRGRYIAMLDGDDYWTDPDKLQRQVDILEREPRLSGVAHDARMRYEMEVGDRLDLFSELVRHVHAGSEEITLDDSILLAAVQTSTFLFRASAIAVLPRWFDTIPYADWALMTIVARQGPIRVLPDVMSVYRRHDASVTMEPTAGMQIARHRWQRQSFLTIADGFPEAVRGRRWKRYELESRVQAMWDEERYLRYAWLLLKLVVRYDRTMARRILADPRGYGRKFIRRLIGTRSARD